MRFLRSAWDRLPRQLRDVIAKVGRDNVTGLAAMVAFTFLSSLFPFLLLVTFAVGKILGDNAVAGQVVNDLGDLLPNSSAASLQNFVDSLNRNANTIGLIALVAFIFTGSSMWSALDTAFGRIYATGSRPWAKQKLFALSMTAFMIVFFVAAAALVTFMTLLESGGKDLPFYLDKVSAHAKLIALAGSALLNLALFGLLYVYGPNRRIGWHLAWPGALFAAVAVTLLLQLFPLYLQLTNVTRYGAAFGFVVLLVSFFYAVSLVTLVGAELNSLRSRMAMGRSAIRPGTPAAAPQAALVTPERD